VVGVMAVARATFDVAHAEETASRAFATLDRLDAEIAGPRSLLFDAEGARGALADLARRRLDLMLVLQVTFTDAAMVKRIADEIEARLALWAFPEPRTGGRLRLNSLCGVNLAAHALAKSGHEYGWVHCAPDAAEARARIERLGARARPRPAPRPREAIRRRIRRGGEGARRADGRAGLVESRPRLDTRLRRRLASDCSASTGHLSTRPSAAPSAVGAARRRAPDRARGAGPRFAGGACALRGLRSRAVLVPGIARCWPEFFTV
jgi:hypothetical protein